jgi:hypothetical protein
MPTSTESARQLAQAIAANADCGGFEDYNFNRARDTWVFTCQTPSNSFEIVAYGSEEARSAGIRSLDAGTNPHLTKHFYAVAVMTSAGPGSTDAALTAFK